jgi:hypothetical protein
MLTGLLPLTLNYIYADKVFKSCSIRKDKTIYGSEYSNKRQSYSQNPSLKSNLNLITTATIGSHQQPHPPTAPTAPFGKMCTDKYFYWRCYCLKRAIVAWEVCDHAQRNKSLLGAGTLMRTDALYLENLVKCRDAHRDLEETDQVNSCEICTRRWGGRPPNGK